MTRRSYFLAPIASLFDVALAPWRRLRLHAVHIAGATAADIPPGTSVLLVANHVSWWDGFLLRDAQKRLRHDAALVTVMSERELRRFAFFRWLGAIGVDATAVSSVRRMLTQLREWRVRRGTALVVSYFPQGRIWPTSRRPLGFARGVVAVAEVLAPVSIIPVALHIEPLASARPHAFVYIGTPLVIDRGRPEVSEIERGVAEGLDRVRRLLDSAGEDAAREWSRVEDV